MISIVENNLVSYSNNALRFQYIAKDGSGKVYSQGKRLPKGLQPFVYEVSKVYVKEGWRKTIKWLMRNTDYYSLRSAKDVFWALRDGQFRPFKVR